MSKFICPDKNDWLIVIKKVSNGFSVQETEGTEEEVELSEFVFEEKEDKKDYDLDAMVNLLYHIKEFLGYSYSKHAKKNIEIKIIDNEEYG